MQQIINFLYKAAMKLWDLWRMIPEDIRVKAINLAAEAFEDFWSKKWEEAQASKEQAQ